MLLSHINNENMKSSSKPEDPDIKKKYVFFSDPDVIAKRAETFATLQVAQSKQALENQPKGTVHATEIPKSTATHQPFQFDLKGLENLLSYHPVQSYPFTFISAVKRKLALSNSPEDCKRAYDSSHFAQAEPSLTVLRSNSTQNLHQVVQKMDFIRPLKVPDLKIAPKTLDFSSRENSMSKELMSTKFEAPSKEFIHEKVEKPSKSFERVQRKLDFSASDASSIISTDIVEPLKVPNISITSTLSKKKDHIRENSREKENRSKRIKKDDSLFGKPDEIVQDFFKRSKSPRHFSRKEFGDSASDSTSATKLKNDRLAVHMPRESDFASTKPKSKNFATSTVKKDDKRHRSFGTRSLKIIRDSSLESKSRTCSNESLSERSTKLPDKVTIREGSRNIFENAEYKYKDEHHVLKQVDDQKNAFRLETREIKQHKIGSQPLNKTGNIGFKEQMKKVPEKTKPSTSKADGKHYIINSEESEDIETVAELRAQQAKGKDGEKIAQSMHSVNLIMLNKATEDAKYTDDSLQQCSSTNTKKVEVTSNQTTTNESNDTNESILSEVLLDPRRISFRDESRPQQEEFCDLVTPDLNLILKSKRRKQFIQDDSELDGRSSKYNPLIKVEAKEDGIQLMQPTALHKQFQAELHLFDSFNESLRQVTDVEKCLYSVNCDQEKELVTQQNPINESHFTKIADERISADGEHFSGTAKLRKQTSDKALATDEILMENYVTSQINTSEIEGNTRRINKPTVMAVEVQTQTVNDIATQTDTRLSRRNMQSRCAEICGIGYDREFSGEIEIPQLSLDSAEQFEDLDQIEEISLPSKLRTMSEISLHETTSSIRTETGTEISISTRDVTCSFNKFLDLEIAQLIKDEKQRYDKIEMLFKSREKTLNDRTKKLVKLEEQKRALRDTGQDSRVSSVKKKQRALLLKLQQEKDEMNRLKELHKIASQERKLMLQKQRNMFNPQMSTKNILTKLKRSADSQSPRRLSGPMKGYDIRSNSSMSSLVDSDKSQHDRSQADARLQISESDLNYSKLDLQKAGSFPTYTEESNASFLRFDKSSEGLQGDVIQPKSPYKSQKEGTKSKYEAKSRKFEEKMPRADILRFKSHQRDVESKLISGHSMNLSGQYRFEKEKASDISQLLQPNLNKSVPEQPKSESDTLVEELSKKSRPSQTTESHAQTGSLRERETVSRNMVPSSETIQEEISLVNQDTISKTSKSSQVSEDILQMHSRSSKKSSKSISADKDVSKKTPHGQEQKSSSKRKSSKCQKNKSSFSLVTENILRSKSSSQMSEEFVKPHNKRTKVDKEFLQSDENDENAILNDTDFNESQNLFQSLVKHSKAVKDKSSKVLTEVANDCDCKENILSQKTLDRNLGAYECSSEIQDKGVPNLENESTKSQVSTFISRHSSADGEKNYSKSVVVRSQDQDFKTSKKLEQILSAREAALASRRNCVEEWMAWHAKLRAEEDRVARMEQAALKLVTASNVFSQQDTTVSSDTSDVEGRIELLTEKLAERRMEMARLKREVRKQTKQKLRALEANLLNQIKKYDTTIYEMRRKLESKKGINKDSKLAIESKSLADFKVPEIPLKRIQDIYRSSDLLRSRSESDLLCTRIQPKDSAKRVDLFRSNNVEDKLCRNATQRSERLTVESRNTNISEHLSSVKIDGTNRSIQSIFDECISEQIECDKLGFGSISSTSDEAYSDKQVRYGIKGYVEDVRNRQSTTPEIGKTVISQSRMSTTEDIKSNVTTAKLETDIATISDAKITHSSATIQSEIVHDESNADLSAKSSQAKSNSLQSEIEEIQISQHRSNSSSRVSKTIESVSELLDYSRKLDYLHLNNKNLHEDISYLENGLKALSEFMLRSNEQSKKEAKLETNNEEKSTSIDISEAILKSDKHEQFDNDHHSKSDKKNEIEVDHKSPNSDISDYLRYSVKSRSYSDISSNKDSIEDVENAMSVIIPEDEVSLSRSNQEIDYEARTKEIMNVIEKSIISEHIKTTESDLNRSSIFENSDLVLSRKNNNLSNNVISHEADTKSVSEAYSKPISEIESISGEATSIYQDSKDAQKSKDEELLEHRESVPHISQISDLPEQDQTLNSFTDLNLNAVENEKVAVTEADKTISTHSDELTRSPTANSLPIFENKLNVSRTPDCISTKVIKSVEIIKELVKDPTSIQEGSSNQDLNSDQYITSKIDRSALVLSEQKNELGDFDGKQTESCSHTLLETSQISSKSPKHSEETKQDKSYSIASFVKESDSKEESHLQNASAENVSFSNRQDWTISDSFDIQQNIENANCEQTESEHSKSDSEHNSTVSSDMKNVSQSLNGSKIQDNETYLASDIEEASLLIPKGESTNIEAYGGKLDESVCDFYAERLCDPSERTLPINEENEGERDQQSKIQEIKVQDIQETTQNLKLFQADKSGGDYALSEKDMHLTLNAIHENVEAIVDEEKISSEVFSLQQDDGKCEVEEYETQTAGITTTTSHAELVRVEAVDEPLININLHVEVKDDEHRYDKSIQTREIVITELEPGSVEEETLPELEINAKIELADDEPIFENEKSARGKEGPLIEMKISTLEPITEQDSSDGEQLDNLVEVAESELDTIEKEVHESFASLTYESEKVLPEQVDEFEGKVDESDFDKKGYDPDSAVSEKLLDESVAAVTQVSPVPNNKTFDIIKDPEYEDISEESLEVSEILERNESQKSTTSQKSSITSEKYQVIQTSDVVLRILDKIAQKSSTDSADTSDKILSNSESKRIIKICEQIETETSAKENEKSNDSLIKSHKEEDNTLDITVTQENAPPKLNAVAQRDVSPELKKVSTPGKPSEEKSEERAIDKREQDASSDSSDCGDTPRGVSEIEMDSPRDPNDSRLDVDALNDDLLINEGSRSIESKTNYHASAVPETSEKDIEVMIDKLRASLEQPGIEVAELEAKLLRLQQLQIELEIKRLEAEEVSYYVREIPNKPPPPYTPPGGGVRISTNLASPSPPPAVIPSNIEELTAFTEKATALIYKAKQAGVEIMSLEPPSEIYELTKENNETMKRDRRIYNTFLFDLCKEIIADVYQSEYEKPGPSWTKPNVKTKPIIKIPKNVDELNEYVSKEVAMLFGFKTKLQRENMVMRWSRKRRDRVDELLAREAQAEEDEWTKFHHDELAVKNDLTEAILGTLVTDTAKVVKVAYAKKRKVMI